MNPANTLIRSLFKRAERFVGTDMRYLVRGGIYLTGSDVLVAFLSLGVSILVAAYVPKDVYGIYKYIVSIAGIAVAFSLTGMNNSVTRAVAAGREGTFLRSFPVQIRFALLQCLAIAVVASYYFYQENYVYGIALSAVALFAPAAGVLNTYVAYLSGKKEFGRLAWWKIQNGIIASAAMAAVVVMQPTVIAITITYFLVTLVVNAWFTWRAVAHYRPRPEYDVADLSYGKHLSVMNSIGMIATQLDTILIYHLLGPVQLAVYSFAVLIPERLRSMLSFLPSIALPKLAQRSPAELKATAYRRMLMLVVLTSGIAIAYVLAAPFIFAFFFPEYLEAVPYTQLAAFFTVVVAPAYLATVLIASGAKRSLYIMSLATPILKVALSVALILTLGLWGAVAARLIAGAFSGLLAFVFIQKSEPGTAAAN